MRPTRFCKYNVLLLNLLFDPTVSVAYLVPEILQNRQMSFIALIYHAKTVPHTFLQTCNDVGLQFTAVFRLNEQVEKATTSTHFHTHDGYMDSRGHITTGVYYFNSTVNRQLYHTCNKHFATFFPR